VDGNGSGLCPVSGCIISDVNLIVINSSGDFLRMKMAKYLVNLGCHQTLNNHSILLSD
jgi:hypothetical protein